MRFQVYIKDPDVFDEEIKEAVDKELSASNLPKDEQEAIKPIRLHKLYNFIDKWVEYGEYITVEFDTEANTAIVVPRKIS